jgi:hypothetical protein
MWEKAVCEEGSVEASGIEGGREGGDRAGFKCFGFGGARWSGI